MSETHKETLDWYESKADEIRRNPDGSITFVFDEPPIEGETCPQSTTTISAEDYQKAKADPSFLV